MLRTIVRRLLAAPLAPLRDLAERQLMLQAQQFAARHCDLDRIGGLHAVEFSAFSQWGEDGIIDWLAVRMSNLPQSFVEFGVQDYRESNTRYLLQSRNWRGLVMDGSAGNIADIRQQNIHWRHDLTAICAFIDRDNINSLIGDTGFGGALGLLSVDVDGNDYWLWDAIDVAEPAIVVCEYNAVLGDKHALTIPYKADFLRGNAHFSGLYFGASIRALVALADRKGYVFAGTASTGCNAFFIRRDLAEPVAQALGNVWAFPSKVRESRGTDGGLTSLGGRARAQLIERLPLIDVTSGAETSLAALGDIYSPEWLVGKPVVWG